VSNFYSGKPLPPALSARFQARTGGGKALPFATHQNKKAATHAATF
jgi:hypothetical protein